MSIAPTTRANYLATCRVIGERWRHSGRRGRRMTEWRCDFTGNLVEAGACIDQCACQGHRAADEIERLEGELHSVHAHLAHMRREIERLRAANERLGNWMAAALDDPAICVEMKADIEAWFDVWFVRKGEAEDG